MFTPIIWNGVKWQLYGPKYFASANDAWAALGDRAAVDVIHVELIQYLEVFGPPIEGRLNYMEQ